MRESDSTEIENAMAAAISPDATDKEIRNLAIENSDKASRIYALTGDKSIYDYAVGSIKYMLMARLQKTGVWKRRAVDRADRNIFVNKKRHGSNSKIIPGRSTCETFPVHA